MTPDLEVSRTIAASPADVYAAITDISRMGEWSPELVRAEWEDGFDGPAVGAIYSGHNKNGEKEWTTQAKIVELVENERFFFDCFVGDFTFAQWGYAIEPAAQGCVLTEYWQDHRPQEMRTGVSKVSGVADRAAFNKASMATTLERVAAAVE